MTSQVLVRDGPNSGDRGPARPVVVGVDGSAHSVRAAETGGQLARQFAAPLVLVYVRKGPPAWMGEPDYQRRLDAEMEAGRAALDRALRAAEVEGVEPSTEVLEGSPARRIREFAEVRNARAVVVGTRPRRIKRSVSQRVIRTARRPVVVAAA